MKLIYMADLLGETMFELDSGETIQFQKVIDYNMGLPRGIGNDAFIMHNPIDNIIRENLWFYVNNQWINESWIFSKVVRHDPH